jgi:hypothetical protein
MISQTVLPFKLEMTEEQLTAHGGLALFGEFLQALNLSAQLNEALPAPGSSKGYAPSQFVLPLVLMLHGGGRTLEDLRQIREDAGLRALLRLEALPSADATGDWLRRLGAQSGLADLATVNRALLRRALQVEARTAYTLDIDATQIVAEKRAAHWTYKGERGYMPMVGHLAELELVLGDEFREGNAAPASRNLEFIQHCAAQMPLNKRLAHLRADSAAYQAEIFNWCEAQQMTFAIGGVLDAAVQAIIAVLPEEQWQPDEAGGHLTEFVHTMAKTHAAFRLVVRRQPVQQDLFAAEVPRLRYTVIATNRTDSPAEVVRWYSQRGETSENRIKELKLGLGMERLPCGTFAANAVFFRLGVLAYNLFVLFKLLALPRSWARCQVQTVRWRLYQLAGKVVRHAGALVLKIRAELWEMCEAIRRRCATAAQA